MTRYDLRLFTPGGDDRIRTGDPLLAKQVLSQLSYIPADKSGGPSWDRTDDLRLAKPALSQLSYSPARPSVPIRLP